MGHILILGLLAAGVQAWTWANFPNRGLGRLTTLLKLSWPRQLSTCTFRSLRAMRGLD